MRLSAGRNRSFSRNKSRRVPVLLLRDMDLCYRLLRLLVPGLPAGRAASRMEILQHVIDYILHLQAELEASCPAGDCGEQRGEELQGHTCQSLQSNDFPKKDSEDEERRTLLH